MQQDHLRYGLFRNSHEELKRTRLQLQMPILWSENFNNGNDKALIVSQHWNIPVHLLYSWK